VRTRPALHEAKDEAEARYYEAEAKNLALRPRWPRGLNIPAHSASRSKNESGSSCVRLEVAYTAVGNVIKGTERLDCRPSNNRQRDTSIAN